MIDGKISQFQLDVQFTSNHFWSDALVPQTAAFSPGNDFQFESLTSLNTKFMISGEFFLKYHKINQNSLANK